MAYFKKQIFRARLKPYLIVSKLILYFVFSTINRISL